MFARFYVMVLLSLLLAGVLIQALVMPGVGARVGQGLRTQGSPSVLRIARDLGEANARGEDLDAAVAHAAARHTLPLALIARAGLTLDAAALARLDGGVVVERGERRRVTLLAGIPGTDRLLAAGPIPGGPPFSEGHGLAALGLILLAVWLGVFLIARPMARRLAGVASAADRFGRGDLAARADPSARDELGGLAREFNGMAVRIERLIASQEELLRMISHELRTPLQRMHFTLEKVRESSDAVERDRALQRTEVDLQECDDLIDELLTYTRLEHVAPMSDAVSLGPLVADLCASFEDRGPGAELVAEAATSALVVRGEARLLRRALSNLIANALRHARSRVEVSAAATGELVCIDVDDDGPGVPDAQRERVFEPFFRLDEAAGRSVGLGLAIVRRIADRSSGRVDLLRSDLGGARFRLSLRLEKPVRG
ncbi:MAG TPA: ATP-binding protein [Kofleriaceae bacterium]|jgi:two-component system sensor histidine kinase RstB|nr:ATP-binding protein [Kofleriaceae bacterium]